jgi:gluconate kinase
MDKERMPNCSICKKDIKNTFLDKIEGTRVFIKKDNRNEEFFACSSCQKKYKDKLKEELSRIR